MTLIWTKPSISVKIEQSDVYSSTAWYKNSVILSLFVFEFALGRGAGGWWLGSFECSSLRALLKCTAAITQAGLRSQTIRSGIVAFKTLRCVIEVAYIFASVKAITVKFLVWENTTRKGLQPLELTSKVTIEFAYNVISRGLHKERNCRIDLISALKYM